MKIRELCDWGCAQLNLAGIDNPRLEAKLLLQAALSVTQLELLIARDDEIDPAARQKFLEYIKRRREGEPIAYILGKKEFYGLEIKVNPAVLVPRPETELLVDLALKFCLCHSGKKLNLLDLGSGSGCIAIAVAKELKSRGLDFSFVLVERSAEAMGLARANAAAHQVEDRLEFYCLDWKEYFSQTSSSMDLVLSNPPYVEVSAELGFSVCNEPAEALFSGQSGLEHIKELITCVPNLLKRGGAFYCEFGANQTQGIKALQQEIAAGAFLKIHSDLEGRDRVFELRMEAISQ